MLHSVGKGNVIHATCSEKENTMHLSRCQQELTQNIERVSSVMLHEHERALQRRERQWRHSGDSTSWIYQPVIFSTVGTSLNWLRDLQVQHIICPLLGSNMDQALSSHYPENVHSWATKQRYVLFDCCEANIPPFLLGTVLPRLNSVQQVTFTCPKCCVVTFLPPLVPWCFASPFCLSFHNTSPPPLWCIASPSATLRHPIPWHIISPFCDVLSPPSMMCHLPLLWRVVSPFYDTSPPPLGTCRLPLWWHVISPFHNVLPPPSATHCPPLWWHIVSFFHDVSLSAQHGDVCQLDVCMYINM